LGCIFMEPLAGARSLDYIGGCPQNICIILFLSNHGCKRLIIKIVDYKFHLIALQFLQTPLCNI
jgi:hypothetical protein